MTPRERLLSVLNHRIPDRVPISTYEMMERIQDSYCKSLSDCSPEKYVYNNILFPYLSGWQNNLPSYTSFLKKINQDTDLIYMTSLPMANKYRRDNTRIKCWREGISTYTRITTGTPKGDLEELFRVDDGVITAWQLEYMIKDDDDIDKFLSIPDDELLGVDVSPLEAQNAYLGDRGILMIDFPDPLGIVFGLFDFGDYMVKAHTDKKRFRKLLDNVYEQQMYFLKDMLKKGAGPLFRIVGPEAATPPFLPKECFHDYVCKYDSEIIRLIHEHGQYARIHCHGRIREVLSHIIEMGADALDPVEAPPSGDIELWEVKKLYGDKICLMGNIQLRDLEQLPPDEMRKLVIKCIEDGKEGGNFVIMPTATPISIPLSPVAERNFNILIDTALEYGQY